MNDRSHERFMGLRHAPIWIGIFVVVALSWLCLVHMSGSMPGMASSSTMTMPITPPMTRSAPIAFLFIFLMWSVMMVAMMVPSAVPAIALFAMLTGRRQPSQPHTMLIASYTSGYIATWIGYSVLAAIAQWALTRAMLVSPMAGSSSTTVSALILAGAGIYQFTPLKDACLTRCRSPLAIFMSEWRDGAGGAFVLGFRQGIYCVACCWILMAIMFVAGVMNLVAMALLTAFFLAEKVAPPAWHISRVSGAVLIAWGVWISAAIWY